MTPSRTSDTMTRREPTDQEILAKLGRRYQALKGDWMPSYCIYTAGDWPGWRVARHRLRAVARRLQKEAGYEVIEVNERGDARLALCSRCRRPLHQ